MLTIAYIFFKKNNNNHLPRWVWWVQKYQLLSKKKVNTKHSFLKSDVRGGEG